ncbi:MAG TPA: TlpA disulfide reductase family protein [Mucilaginibacter sp.]|nr:TlpA disulfide reductase family protein [Mucilaginibacter sp.]
MNSLGAHKAYIYAMGISNPLVIKQYNEWMKKYPQNINIPLAIGTVYYNAEMPQAKQFLLRVVESEPGNAKVWYMLSADAERWGQEDLSAKYMRKAALADSSNADYAFYYLLYFENGDPKEYARRVFDFVKRFPANNHGAQALYWLAENTIDANDKISYFEELRKLYPPQKFQWSSVGMMRLTDAYLQINPEKALALINEMGGGKDWAIRKQVAESLIQVNKLEQDQNYKEALLKLDEIKLPKFTHLQDFIVLKKFSLEAKAGDVKTAYDSVAARFARLPTDQLYTELELLGGKIGKNKAQISKDIVTIRNSTAVTAYPFELGLYTGNGTLNLNSLKGKVVLLTFWFPACGPCRDEFPHFQAVINKFKGEDVAYIGINISPDQDPYVIPFMKNTKYSFIPLRGSPEFAAKYYGVDGEPGNFLIDKNGKIVFKDFNIGSTNQRTLQLMISSLLKKNQPDN